jgi:lysozyme
MNDHLKLSYPGVKLIQHFESCLQKKGEHYHAYKCPAGVTTIGWGHTNHHGKQFDASARWTMEECNEAFLEDMEGFERAVRKNVKVPLQQHQFDSLVSFTFNVGEGALKSSTLLRKLNAGDYEGAAKEFKRWDKANGKTLPGLMRRRASEALMFMNTPDLNYDGKPDPMPQAVDSPE